MAQFRIVSMLLLSGCVSLGQALQIFAADNRVQILNFSMERCEPCRAMQPVLAKLIMDGWQVRDIDVAKEPQLAAQFKLKSAPTLVVLSGGRELDRVVGTIAYSKLLARLEAASRGSLSSSPSNSSSQPAPSSIAPPLTSPQPLAMRNPAASDPMSIEPSIVRGQSPGPSAVPDLDIDNERMLDFVKDLPEAPKFATAAAPTPSSTPSTPSTPATPSPAFAAPAFATPAIAQPSPPSNVQPASSSANLGRSAVQSLGNGSTLGNVTPATTQPQFDPTARAQQATVRIRIEDANSISFGTGTVIYVHNGQALVLTCGHLFRDLGQRAQMSIDVFDSSGRVTNVPAQVVSHSTEEGDIGLMEFRCPFPIVPVPISKRAPAVNETAFSFGCDRGADPTRRDTQIKRINRYLGPANVEIHGAPVVGRSGGGLFNAQGQLIGVCNAADAEDDEGIYAALPVIDRHVAALRLDALPSDDANVLQNPIQLASAPMNIGQVISPAAAAIASGATPPSATQVRCVIRDGQGKEIALLIDRPSEELVAMLKQSAQR